MSIPYLDDLVVDGERVLVRADLNVPLVDGTVGDAFRIEASVPTIQELRRRGASVIVATHLGRPDGIDPALSTKPVAERLGELGGFPVVHAPAVIGQRVDATVTGRVSQRFSQLVVVEAAGKAISQVPAWLNEGLAEYGNSDPTDDYDAALRYGIFTRRIKPLWFLNSFGGTPEDIIIAYGQGRSVVKYMIDNDGEERMAALFPVLQRTMDIDKALLEVYGMDQFGLDTAWRITLGLEPLPSPGELANQLDEKTETADPEIAQPEDTEGDTGTAAEATTMPESTPEADARPAGATGDEGEEPEGGSSSPGCSAPAGGSGNASTGVGLLLLLGAPLGLVAFPRLRRPWPFASPQPKRPRTFPFR